MKSNIQCESTPQQFLNFSETKFILLKDKAFQLIDSLNSNILKQIGIHSITFQLSS